MRRWSSLRYAFTAVLTLTVLERAHGQANCSLRDPDRQINMIFPEATRHLTIQATDF